MSRTADLSPRQREDRLAGALLGTALGDALGLPAEGMSAAAVRRRFGRIESFRLLGATGFVSDDTEQAALVAQSLARSPDDPERCVREFRRALLGWFLRLPWGAGRATLIACGRIALGLRVSGIPSAGNGAAMRAAVIGVYFADAAGMRERFGRALAEVTHRDARAVEGAQFTAELAAACALQSPAVARAELLAAAREAVREPSLAAALDRAADLAARGAPPAEARRVLGTSGYVIHTLAFAAYCFLRDSGPPLETLAEAVNAGGDADSIGAILGAWLGSLHGASGLPADLLGRIHDGPFGPTHLRALAACLSAGPDGASLPVPVFSPTAALARNLALYPVIIGHGLARLGLIGSGWKDRD